MNQMIPRLAVFTLLAGVTALTACDGVGLTEPAQRALLSTDVTTAASNTPVVDGVLSAGEWSKATIWKGLMINVPEGGTTEGKLMIANDDVNLYVALLMDRDIPDTRANFAIIFNNDGVGALAEGDDWILGRTDGSFRDGFFSTRFGGGLRGVGDTADPTGTVDGSAAGGRSRGRTVIELAHPLDTTDDDHDISVAPGDALTFFLQVNLFNPHGEAQTSFAREPLTIACSKNGKVFRARFCPGS